MYFFWKNKIKSLIDSVLSKAKCTLCDFFSYPLQLLLVRLYDMSLARSWVEAKADRATSTIFYVRLRTLVTIDRVDWAFYIINHSDTFQASHCANVEVCQWLMKEWICGLLILQSKLKVLVIIQSIGKCMIFTSINVYFSLTHVINCCTPIGASLHGQNFIVCQDSLQVIEMQSIY